MGLTQIDLSKLGPETLSGAVLATLQDAPEALAGCLPTPNRLKQGAQATTEDRLEEASTYFQSLLEIGYLVASADGFASEERHALAMLLEHLTGSIVAHDAFELHFQDLDAAVEMLGRRERLRRAAADFEDGIGRGEALGFAALVAIADGKLAEPEEKALLELGTHFGLNEEQVGRAVNSVVERLRARLGT